MSFFVDLLFLPPVLLQPTHRSFYKTSTPTRFTTRHLLSYHPSVFNIIDSPQSLHGFHRHNQDATNPFRLLRSC